MAQHSRTKSAFNPSNFVKTAEEIWQARVAYQKYIKENAHMMAPFHVDGLEKIIPPQLPGELAIFLGRSHHGKSTALRDVIFKSQRRIEGKKGAIVGLVSLEDTAEMTASKQVRKYGGDSLAFRDDQFVYIGNSFGMSLDDMAEIHVGNMIKALDYGRKEKFAEPMEYAYIGMDYAQLFPEDPDREIANSDQLRIQAYDNTKRIYHAAKYFKCPIGLAAQANMKDQKTNYTGKMRIPGPADIQEAAAYYQIPDIVYSYWQPKHDHPIGTQVEEGPWSFKVEKNLCFIRITKRRNCDEFADLGYQDVVGTVWPCWIQADGSYAYDAEKHKHMVLKQEPS